MLHWIQSSPLLSLALLAGGAYAFWCFIRVGLGPTRPAPPQVLPNHTNKEGVTYYRTRDGQEDYGFKIERQRDGGYRVYIVSQPSYGGRDAGSHMTHRLTDSDGRRYICWDRPVRTEAEARYVAALWADATQDYIRTGRRF